MDGKQDSPDQVTPYARDERAPRPRCTRQARNAANDGRLSTFGERIELIQGTLDMLVLQTLLNGPAYGHAIAKHIQQTTDNVLAVEHGSLYPALHRLEHDGWINATWETPPDRKRKYKFYCITPAGRTQLVRSASRWDTLVRAIERVMGVSPERLRSHREPDA
jgi:PadR family transcriptional regulator PadR